MPNPQYQIQGTRADTRESEGVRGYKRESEGIRGKQYLFIFCLGTGHGREDKDF